MIAPVLAAYVAGAVLFFLFNLGFALETMRGEPKGPFLRSAAVVSLAWPAAVAITAGVFVGRIHCPPEGDDA